MPSPELSVSTSSKTKPASLSKATISLAVSLLMYTKSLPSSRQQGSQRTHRHHDHRNPHPTVLSTGDDPRTVAETWCDGRTRDCHTLTHILQTVRAPDPWRNRGAISWGDDATPLRCPPPVRHKTSRRC